MNQKAKTYGMIAGILKILFTLLGIASLAISMQNSGAGSSASSIQQFLPTLAWNLLPVLFGVALVIDNLLMARIVAGVQVLIRAVGVVATVASLVRSGTGSITPQTTVGAVLLFVGAGLLLAALLLPGRRGQLLAFLSVGVNAVRIVLQNIEFMRTFPGPALFSTGTSLFLMIPDVLVALYIGAKGSAPAPTYAVPSRPLVDNRSPLEKLAWLQDMLARGYMEQQEYEEKKNEILDVDMPVSDKLAWYENLVQKGYMTRQEYDSRREALLRNYMGQ